MDAFDDGDYINTHFTQSKVLFLLLPSPVDSQRPSPPTFIHSPEFVKSRRRTSSSSFSPFFFLSSLVLLFFLKEEDDRRGEEGYIVWRRERA